MPKSHRVHRGASTLVRLSLLLTLLGCSAQEKSECSSDAECKGTRVCEDGECVENGGSGGTHPAGGASGDGGKSGGATGGSSTGGAGAEDGGTDNGGTDNGGADNGAGASDRGGGGNSGGTAGGVAMPAACPVPTDATVADEAYGYEEGKDEVSLTFDAGTLVALDSSSCRLDTSGVRPSADSREDSPTSRTYDEYPCHEGFDCGGCLVFLVGSGANEPGHWMLVGASTATDGATPGCADYSGRYSFCVPNCEGKRCGDNDGCGGVCGCSTSTCCNAAQQCVVDECAECLSTCFEACEGIPDPSCASSCCTGTGCQCAGACPGPCVPI